MLKKRICVFLLLGACFTGLGATGWEWQFSLGPWTLQPLSSPVERLAERIVADEVKELLAPLLSAFTILSFRPQIEFGSRGLFLATGIWRQLAAGRFAVGLSAACLRFTLPFVLNNEQTIIFQGVPLATISTSGAGRIDLQTFMMEAQGRWRVFQRRRVSLHASLGLALLHLRGDLHLPLTARVDSLIGSAELNGSLDTTLYELRKKNEAIPGWSLSPALGASIHYRLGRTSHLFIDARLSQGTFLAGGLALDF